MSNSVQDLPRVALDSGYVLLKTYGWCSRLQNLVSMYANSALCAALVNALASATNHVHVEALYVFTVLADLGSIAEILQFHLSCSNHADHRPRSIT